jgi:hypothetical protein
MAEAVTMAGGCLCGAVRYRCTQPAKIQFECHCRDCQKVTGGPYAPIMFFPQEAVEIRGEVRWYESAGGSGRPIRRGFCPTCGAQMFGIVEIVPGTVSIRAGTLDDPSQFQPRVHIYASQAAPWDHLDPALPSFAERPPSR